MRPVRTRTVLSLFFAVTVFLAILSCAAAGASGGNTSSDALRVSLPYSAKSDTKAKYLYAVGGYHSVDNGAPAWGTSNYADIRLIGDRMGTLDIEYADGTVDSVPLIFGYTMWFYNNWKEDGAPFKGSGTDKDLKAVLTRSLSLLGAFEGKENCVLRIALRDKAIKKIKVTDDPGKNGEPLFSCAFLANDPQGTLSDKKFSFSAADSFFNAHTVDSADPLPAQVRTDLETLRHALYTYEEDYTGALPFTIPGNYSGPRIYFSGNPFADIATGVVYTNLKNLAERTDKDGFMHTSYKGAPSWRYDGFGVWVENADSYYDSFYSRDGGRGIMSLLLYGENGKAQAASMFANRQMMYFRDKNITFNGSAVPGHYTVIVNKPLHYSEVLVPNAGWPTAYTKAAFGDDYKNLGNQETDGHGLMMLANYNTWRSAGRSADWVKTNWTHIKEACEWIKWCLDNPELSLSKNGLLYAESEAGMMKYTLYCNFPCYLGLKGYAQMAEAAGYAQEASEWARIAAELRQAMLDRLSNQKGWISARFGFYHDPVLTMMADFYGFDAADMENDLVELSRLAYGSDTGKAKDNGWYGAPGIGYDHSMLTQNALLSDNMSDAAALLENLCRLSYSPRLPEPYMVPEGISVDRENGIIRRQGDLGNLVQQAEALKCYAIAAGVSPVLGSTLKLMPRLPESWSIFAKDVPVGGDGSGYIDYIVTYPAEGAQIAQFMLKDTKGIDSVKLRLGPFPKDTLFASAKLDDAFVPCEIVISGDSVWAWVDCGAPSAQERRVAVIYGNDVNNMPGWSDNWQDLPDPENGGTSPDDNIAYKNKYTVYIVIAAAALLLTAAAIPAVLILKKKGHRSE